jgi:hypothetical protein
MTPNPSAPTNNIPPATPQPLVPAEPPFMKRYSPHNEFPLSSVISVTFYGLLGVLACFVVLFLYPWLYPNQDPIQVEPLAIEGGGGGGDGGTGEAGKGNPADRKEEIPDTADKLPDSLKPSVPLTDLKRPSVNPNDFQAVIPPEDKDSTRYIEEGNLAAAAFGKVKGDAQKKLMDSIGTGTGKPGKDGGRDGGRDGGTGPGKDKGVGPGSGPGGLLNERQKRVLRWTMMFDTINGDDYRRQLAALGAILGVPGPDGYIVLRDLSRRPATGKVEDLKDIKRIFWIDNRPESIGPLATALGLPNTPDHIVAFFPEKMEADLLRKELRFRGLKEHEIQETRFRVVRRGSGYEPVVVDQRP